MGSIATLADYRRLVPPERGLATAATRRRNGTIQATVVNTGVLAHPVHGEEVVGFVAIGGTVKLANLRRDPHVAVTVRSGWEWVTVEGRADLIGPDDACDGFAAARLPQLLRDVFLAAGGTHDDWDEYDRVMAAERRTAVLVEPERVYSNRR